MVRRAGERGRESMLDSKGTKLNFKSSYEDQIHYQHVYLAADVSGKKLSQGSMEIGKSGSVDPITK